MSTNPIQLFWNNLNSIWNNSLTFININIFLLKKGEMHHMYSTSVKKENWYYLNTETKKIWFRKKTINNQLRLENRVVCREVLTFKYEFVVFFRNESDNQKNLKLTFKTSFSVHNIHLNFVRRQTTLTVYSIIMYHYIFVFISYSMKKICLYSCQMIVNNTTHQFTSFHISQSRYLVLSYSCHNNQSTSDLFLLNIISITLVL